MIGLWILGVLLIVLGVPMLLGVVPRNDFYGLRTRETMEGSEEKWFELNRKAGFTLVGIGVMTLLACAVLSFLRSRG